MIIGLKLLREDGSSLREQGRMRYPPDEWIEVPGNGAYVAVTDGLTSGGMGPLLVVVECQNPTGTHAPYGVTCYRGVRRLGCGVPSAPALAEYERARAPAWAEYERVRALALIEYEQSRAPALAEYRRVYETAWAQLIEAARKLEEIA